MICTQKKFIFFRNAKTGTSSIIKYFREKDLKVKKLPPPPEVVLYTGFLKTYKNHHSPSSVFRRDIRPDQFNEYFKFSFVRNPWDRMISLWKYKVSHDYVSFMKSTMRSVPTRRPFNFWDKYSGSSMEEYASINRMTPREISFESFMLYSKEEDYKCLFETGVSFNQYADFIGKFENLNKDFKFICDKINVPCEELPHINPSFRKKRYQPYYNNKLKNLVGDLFYDDIKKFNYTF
jgi:hypothetical protein